MATPQKFNIKSFVSNTQTPRILVLGATGSGKTVFLRSLCNYFQLKKWRVIALDLKTTDFPYWKTYNAENIMNNETFIRKVIRIVLPDGSVINDPATLAEYVCVHTWNQAPCIAYIEEASMAVKKHDDLAVSHPAVYRVLQQGRSVRAGIFISTQMGRQTNEAFFDQASDIFVFAMKPKELRYIEDKLGLRNGTLKFNIPTKEEYKKGTLKDLFRFYHIEGTFDPIFYERLPKSQIRDGNKEGTILTEEMLEGDENEVED